MKYTLNGEKVLDFRLSSEVCVSDVAGDNWEEKWRKKIVKKYFLAMMKFQTSTFLRLVSEKKGKGKLGYQNNRSI